VATRSAITPWSSVPFARLSFFALARWPLVVIPHVDVRHAPCAKGLPRIVAALTKVLRFHVADMQEPVATDAEIHERGLDGRFQIDNSPLIDVADIVVRT